MVTDKDNYLEIKSNQHMKVCMFSSIGDREEQQDAADMILNADDGIIVVCDGMGGHRGGKLASSIAVRVVLDAYTDGDFSEESDIGDIFRDVIADADYEISRLRDEDGEPLKSGTTIVSTVIKGKNIYWASVGDSRIYLIRNNEMIQVTKDHTYELALKENLEAGLITASFVEEQKQSSGALISFIGNGIPYIDSNREPFHLCSGDKIIMMSDGLYKYLSDETILSIISGVDNIEETVKILDNRAKMAAWEQGVKRDNMTVAIVEIN